MAFDPDLDLAVLEVPDLGAPPLPRTGALERATGVVVAGFPQDGPYRVTPARVRGVLYAPGDDIYGGGGSNSGGVLPLRSCPTGQLRWSGVDQRRPGGAEQCLLDH